ncbi:MAG: pseudouridine synthase, partial [Caldimicrobium sp.]
ERDIKMLLRDGIILEEKKVKPLEFDFIKKDGRFWVYRVTVKEGVKREVRKMVSYLGSKVYRLLRIAFGTLELNNLKPGEIRPLSFQELKKLKEHVQLKSSKILESTSSGELT